MIVRDFDAGEELFVWRNGPDPVAVRLLEFCTDPCLVRAVVTYVPEDADVTLFEGDAVLIAPGMLAATALTAAELREMRERRVADADRVARRPR